LQDREVLLEENRRLWLDLEETKVALAYEAKLRSATVHASRQCDPNVAKILRAPSFYV
jgi:hypothetical protein